jgi:AcrR family transcriptional regulator
MVAETGAQAGIRIRRSSADTREHVLSVAAELFYWDGIRATGVDTVAARAEVAPTTILAVFDAFADEVLSASHRGCPFLMVLAEFPDPKSVPHVSAVAHKTWLRALFRDLVRALGKEARVRQPARLADHLALVAEGIYGSVPALGASGPARQGPSCAAALIAAAIAPAGR